jgi:hypothetical protein
LDHSRSQTTYSPLAFLIADASEAERQARLREEQGMTAAAQVPGREVRR